jgi:hypothetical protein
MINQEFSTISSTSNDNLTIISPSEPITWYKDSKVNLIIWTITNNTRDTISFDVIRNGTVEYSGMAEQIPFLHSIHVFHRVPISEMDYGTYNYTLVATDSVENKSATIILNLIEGASNTINPLLYALIFPALIGGVAVLYLVIFRFSPLNRYFGGTSCSEA